MPIYEYQCKDMPSPNSRYCNLSMRITVSSYAPDCGAEKPTKVFSSFASIGNGKAAACETGST